MGAVYRQKKPFLAETRVRIRITYNGAKFEAIGRVTYATSDSYMGILFARVETKDQLVLEKWVAEREFPCKNPTWRK